MPVPLRTANNLKVEAKFNVVTEFPNFDLHSAAAAGNIGLVEYALSRGQPVNSVLDGVLPLHAACAGGDEQVVKLLIDHGADVNAPRLPRKYSTGGGRDASAPIVGTSGSTPLHFAAANGNKNIILTLLLRGAHPDRPDKHGVTPEMLARRHKWVECAELLHNWVDRRDRDLRERQNPVDESLGPGTEPEASTSRRRIQVKRSIDTALNMLKVSSTGLSEAYLRPPASSSSSNFPSQTPPASPSRGDYLPSDDGRFSPTPSPSPIDLATRRPSLPHVFDLPPVASSRSSKPATLTKSNPSAPRRPRSAGNDADREEESGYPTYGRGGAGRLGNKVSLMNLFKKPSENESGVASHHSSSSLSIPISPTSSNQSAAANFESGTPPSRPSRVQESSTRARTPSTSQGQVGPLHSKPSPGQEYSPSHPPKPLAVDFHNAFAQQQATRDRSGSSGSRIDQTGLGINIDDNVRYGSPGSVSGSPLARFGLLRRGPSGQLRDRSGSGASLGAFSSHRNGGVFDEDVVSLGDAPGKAKSSKPGVPRGHHRSTSFGQTQQNSRALRFDPSGGNQSKFKDVDRVPESAPPNIADFGPHDEIMEEDDEYGKPLQRSASRSAISSAAEDLSTSPNFPFSLDNPPISVEDPDSPVTVRVRGMYEDHRGRGNSVSSNSTADSLFNPAQTSPSETASPGSGTVTTPVLSAGESSSFQYSPGAEPKRPDVERPDQKPERFKLGRRGNNVLDIDINLIESHAEAEALVQRTQQDILDLHPDYLSPDASSSNGWTPLSAKLAAYGESLALEKRLRQQKEKAGDPSPSTSRSPVLDDSTSPTSKIRSGVNRQSSLGNKPKNRVRAPKRPHTSSGTSSSCDTPADTSDVDIPSSAHNPSRSAPAEDYQYQDPSPQYIDVARARTPDLDERSSRVSSFDGIDGDFDFGSPLTRVSTAPMSSSLKGRRDQSRTATKLTRMGFPNDLTRAPTPATTSKRFGSGFKSLMQSFKGKP